MRGGVCACYAKIRRTATAAAATVQRGLVLPHSVVVGGVERRVGGQQMEDGRQVQQGCRLLCIGC
jgi:hypothetical protein